MEKYTPVEQEEFLRDFPKGPLDEYRNKASFNWKEMAVTIEDEKILRFKHKIWKTLEKDPLFAHSPIDLTMAEQRELTMKRVLKIIDYNFLPEEELVRDIRLSNAFTVALQQYDGSVATKKSIFTDFFSNAVRGAGTRAHYKFVEAALSGKILGCVAITEVGHGSNTKGIRTKATYNPQTGLFILNTPDFEAAKCWAGNLGKSATHAYVFAQLYTQDGECHGLNSFLVPIRNPKTMLPYPGVKIGDLGPKLGLNGLDNGFMMFDNYQIPKTALLNKLGDITADGKFVSPYKNPSRRFGASLGNLSAARAGLIPMIAQMACDAVTIAIRYSAVRRQFGPSLDREVPILEYQTQQFRLFPYLAGSYVMKFLGQSLFNHFISFLLNSFSQQDSEEGRKLLASMGAELHALSCAAKALASWFARDAIQECREACGGHGYLKAAGLGILRDDNDANCTHEGDNHVILQQTSNWLLAVHKEMKDKTSAEIREMSPLESLNFLCEKSTGKNTHHDNLKDPKLLLNAYQWLLNKLLIVCSQKFDKVAQTMKVAATQIKNQCQIYYLKDLSLVFVEYYALENFFKHLCSREGMKSEIKNVLIKLLLLYGYWNLERHLGVMHENGFSSSISFQRIRHVILELCSELKNEAVALVDVVAPPDFILNSILGSSDGNVYKNFEHYLNCLPNGFQRLHCWEHIVEKIKVNQSKL